MRSREGSSDMDHGMMSQFITDVKAVVWSVIVTKRTRSLSHYRLYRLSKRTPRRVPGTFRFPFGRIRYIDAFSLFCMYSDIIFDRVYDVSGLPDKPHIVDCGGNIGISTIWFKHRYPDSTIEVFEADPAIADVLRENVRRLGLKGVEVVSAAVGDKNGAITFTPEGTLSGRVDNGPGLTIDSIRLSDRIVTPVDLLKIDIEGSEYSLLTDLCETGKIGLVRHIVCEMHGDSDAQKDLSKVIIDLSHAGFRLALAQLASVGKEPTPFPRVSSTEFVLLLYAWRDSDRSSP